MMTLRVLASFVMLSVALASPTIQTKKADTSYRLPSDIEPEEYIVCLIPYLDDEPERLFTFDGSVNIRVTARNATDVITLHSNQLNITDDATEVTLDDNGSTKLEIMSQEMQPERHFFHIKLKEPLVTGTKYIIHVKFNGKLNDEMTGFYRSSYAQGDDIKWMATTQFQPTHARKAFPCFDEPAMKATFVVNIAHKSTLHALGNMPVNTISEPDPNVGGRIWTSFQKTKPMSTYLVAFIISDFKNLTNGIYSVWARQDVIDQAQYSLSIVPQVMDELTEYTGIEYPLPKQDHVAITDFSAGAMENWGLITYRESGLMYDKNESPEVTKQRVATIVAHETAHMWFGNLVTPHWWSYAWLNEGFARFLQYKTINTVENTWDLMDQFVVDQLQTIFAIDSLVNSIPLNNECNSPAEITASFGKISYQKGAAVLRMLNHVLTPKTFQRGVSEYLTALQYSTATPEILFEKLDKVAEQDNVLQPAVTVGYVMPSWTTQSGYPVVTVSRSSTNKISFSQKRFLLTGNEKGEQESLWWIPLTWTTGSQESTTAFQTTKPQAWIRNVKDVTFEIDVADDEWIIFNNQLTGYYRVAYDKASWQLILKAMQDSTFEDIHVLNRAQIIDDALNLARAGLISYDDALAVTKYLEHELNHIAWVAASNGFSYLDARLYGLPNFSAFKGYVLQNIGTLYKNVTFNDGEGENQLTTLSRVIARGWACKYALQDCVDASKSEFNGWMANDSMRISPNKRGVVYCTALKVGGKREWDFLWEQYLKAKGRAAEQAQMLSSLGCTNDAAILQQYLMKSITENSNIRKQDVHNVFTSVYNNPKGVNLALTFLTKNFGQMMEFYIGNNALANCITGIAGKLTTKAQVDTLAKFLEDNATDLGQSTIDAGAKAIEAARNDLEWSGKYSSLILSWMVKETGIKDAAVSIQVNFFLVVISAFTVYITRQ